MSMEGIYLLERGIFLRLVEREKKKEDGGEGVRTYTLTGPRRPRQISILAKLETDMEA